MYLIEQGCARLCLLDSDGRETSTQFFFEGEIVSSIESLLTGLPSAQSLITLETCRLRVLEGAAIKARVQQEPALQAELQAFTLQRLVNYVDLYTSAIAKSPTQRYQALLAAHQQRLERIPLHILASFLGVSAVHLSRIRRKLKDTPSADAL
ncbi:Crp/Fnr family transcriptional regulator [Curvibacter lanceolatus]|uniref:Crp/Fnr family transcriptional regulator n=1 Tax=Curvibacter lanceolatus TaxID=86182 RepID=UPI00039CBA7F|nr:Crp/Fnr family transcriptional regulator [Curvibacter lanceolatus]